MSIPHFTRGPLNFYFGNDFPNKFLEAVASKYFDDNVLTSSHVTRKIVCREDTLPTHYQIDDKKYVELHSRSSCPLQAWGRGTLPIPPHKHGVEWAVFKLIVIQTLCDSIVYTVFIYFELFSFNSLCIIKSYPGGGLRLDSPSCSQTQDICISMAKNHYHNLTLMIFLAFLHPIYKIIRLSPVFGFHNSLHFYEFFTFKNRDINFVPYNIVQLSLFKFEEKKSSKSGVDLLHYLITVAQIIYSKKKRLFRDLYSEKRLSKLNSANNKKTRPVFFERKYMGVMSSWDRQFVFLEGGNLMGAAKGDLVGQLLMEIDSSTLVHAADTDDRRHVFQVTSSKKCITLQALNDRERDEWMLTIHNLAKDGGYVKDDKIQQPGILSGMGQYIADKIAAAQSAIGNTPGGSSPSSPLPPNSGSVSPLPAAANNAIPKDAPIVFDLLNITEEGGPLSVEEDKENIEELSAAVGTETESSDDATAPTFSVRFLGSMGINVDRGQSVVCEVMRRILAARAIHNVFSTSELKFKITKTHVSLIDANSGQMRLKHSLCDLAYWAAHTENQKLVGYIVRQRDASESNENNSFSCFVFEADQNGKEICSALGFAAKHAYKELVEKKTAEKKRKQEARLTVE
ncbi:unnamed protein product, partial [Meganyctiphanes norvegica]